MFAVTSWTVGSTLRWAPLMTRRVGTRTSCPSRTSRATSSVPTKPVPPSTQTVSARPDKRAFQSLQLLGAQRHEQYRISPTNFEHERRGALCLVPQLWQRGDLGAIRADDDVAAAQPVLGRRATRFDALHHDAAAIRRVREARAF